MRRAQVLTPWAGSGTQGDPFRPLLLDLFAVRTYEDVTGQASAHLPPAPNLMVAEIRCGDDIIAAISADPDFGPGSILTDEPDE